MRILFTGGSGTLGKALIPLLEKRNEVWAPPRTFLDVTNADAWLGCIRIFQPDTIVHTAAFTHLDLAEKERETCYRTNVLGTRYGVHAAKETGARFVYFSSELVFGGETGNYDINAIPDPKNFFGLTKALAEMIVSEYENGAIIRTSFAADGTWGYKRAWVDVYTSKEFISKLAPDLALAIVMPFTGIVHIAGSRKTVFELAKQVRPDVEPASRLDAPFPMPADVSLDSSSWAKMKKLWNSVRRGSTLRPRKPSQSGAGHTAPAKE